MVKRVVLTLFYVMLAVVGTGSLARDASPPLAADVLVIPVSGPIGPALSDFVARGLVQAHEEGRRAVIILLDTPGGLDSSMRIIIKAIIASPVPVISYVAPGGARAASAGTYILYASHAAAMAPATNLGAATPVSIAPGMAPGDDRRPDDRNGGDSKDETGAPASPSDAMERKMLNDAVAYIRALAELRGRNVDWAEDAVREGASLSAGAALERGVIDVTAEDIDELLQKLDGWKVKVGDEEVTLETAGWTTAVLELDWRSELLAVITNPNVAYVLMLLGVYGLLFELYSPGAIIPGVVGAISLLLALYAFQLLPVNYAGVALILVGIGLMLTELVSPSFGALGVGGVVAFIAGSIILIDTDVEGLTVSLPLVVSVAVIAGALFVSTILLAVRQRTRPIVSGQEEMVGATAQATESFSVAGHVRAHGELWSARSTQPVCKGQHVRITDIDGLTLEVEPIEKEK